MNRSPPQSPDLGPDVSVADTRDSHLNRSTVRKLDFILLPFLSLLFLFNSLDKSNIGSAETGHFTDDIGLPHSALNTSVACFFAVFVTLQPVGAAFGRKYGMARWVPGCMALWGLCTALHVTIREEWQLVTLRVLVGALEAGFYPTTVSYLSLFYTKFEFAKRLGLFYGQAAIAGALGGLLSWAVYSHFPDPPTSPDGPAVLSEPGRTGWKSWQVLFLIEGSVTMMIAVIGFFWLPHSADTAWFLSKDERAWAEERIRRDRQVPSDFISSVRRCSLYDDEGDEEDTSQGPHLSFAQGDNEEASRSLLAHKSPSRNRNRRMSAMSAVSVTADTGLSRSDVLSAFLDWKVWYLLVCNILSAIPATAFSVFLPLVIKGIASSEHGELPPARANLLTIPPFLGGAIVLWTFTAWSDRQQVRLTPILWGLGILLTGLISTVLLPTSSYTLRYAALTILLSGSFIASPLTVAWLTNNIPEPGKRAIVLGINGWGNLSGVLSALLFAPRYEKDGYMVPFYVTLVCVLVAFVGFWIFRALIIATNSRRETLSNKQDSEDAHGEDSGEDAGHVPSGDDRLNFRYSL